VNARQISVVVDLGDPANGGIAAGVEGAGVKVDSLLPMQGCGDLEAKPRGTRIDRNSGIDSVGIGDPEHDLAVAIEASFFSPRRHLLTQIDPAFAPGKPFYEHMEVEGFLKKGASQLPDSLPVLVIDTARDDRLVPDVQFAAFPALKFEELDPAHTGHAEISDHNIAAAIMACTEVAAVSGDRANGSRIAVREDLISPHEEEALQHIQYEQFVVEKDHPRLAHLSAPGMVNSVPLNQLNENIVTIISITRQQVKEVLLRKGRSQSIVFP
jgi:hypothetical protein